MKILKRFIVSDMAENFGKFLQEAMILFIDKETTPGIVDFDYLMQLIQEIRTTNIQ